MADTTASAAGANCMEKTKSYLKTQKGSILAGEIVSSPERAPNLWLRF